MVELLVGQLVDRSVCGGGSVHPESLQIHCTGATSFFSVYACFCSKFSLDIGWAKPHGNRQYLLWVPKATAQSRRGARGQGPQDQLASPATVSCVGAPGKPFISSHISDLLEGTFHLGDI